MRISCTVLALNLAISTLFAQKCDVDSGFRGSRFNVYYEQRHLVNVFHDVNELPPSVRAKLFEHLVTKLGPTFEKRLEFDEGQRLDLAGLRTQFPNLYKENLQFGMYDLLFRFSDRPKGLRYFYAKIALKEDGAVSREIGLPNIGKNPSKGRIISCREAIETAVKRGFVRDVVTPEFSYSSARDSFVWTIWGGRLDPGPPGPGCYRKMDVDANTGAVLRVYTECIAF